jgi:curved DNA-binding protein CbpA
VKYTEVTLLELAENPDHFAVLGVPVTANDEQVKAAYFELVRQLHPDRCRGTDSDLYEATLAAFMRVGRAWEVLKDVRSRRAYKRSRAKLRPAPRQSVDVGAIIELAAKRLHGDEYWAAIRMLEDGLSGLPREEKTRAGLLIAIEYAKDRRWRHRAIALLGRLFQADPQNAMIIRLLAIINDAQD